eukprot:TRINITY_DN2965_c0_g1_i3.p1 TRINITY_DN2965_c0_g1~~TRINITY_DN2965_c0_g1_i3.p1  ORF type:complete len:420 (-),score=93.00 TRINITY_DN2965_c0_g1_i3:63-1322(-)
MIRRPPRSTLSSSSAASDVYKRQKVKSGTGMVKVLRSHAFTGVERLDSDEDVYGRVRRLVRKARDDKEACTVFMYGMTGSGKTYTTDLIHRLAPSDLFESCDDIVELVSYELIGNRCFDLLGSGKQEVFLRVGQDGTTHVRGVTEQTANSPEQLHALLVHCAEQRETGTTGTNSTSSRSHAVYQMRVKHGGSFTVIDLAGNEGTIETAYHSRAQMKEAAEINSSLSTLRQCLHARAAGKSHIPFRESVLTRVLRDALTSAEVRIAVVACVSPACSHLERTLATLRSAVELSAECTQISIHEEQLREEGIRRGGPTKWSVEELECWLTENGFGQTVVQMPRGTTGSQIMKLTAARLMKFCHNGDSDLAKDLFQRLRHASKQAAELDKKLRRELKNSDKPSTSAGFSRSCLLYTSPSPRDS